MRILYTTGVYILGGIYQVAALFVPKARQWVHGRKHWRADLQDAVSAWPADAFKVWIHCASLGEFEQGRPLLERIRAERPGVRILLTFFSPSGYEIRKDYTEADQVMYLPIDYPANARDFLDILAPDLGILVKYEFWWNLISTAEQKGVPMVLIAGLFRPGQYFFKPFGKWFLSRLSGFTHFYVQDENSAQVLYQGGIEAVTVVGDPRVDRVMQIASGVRSFPEIATWRADRPCLVVGSSWPPDETMLYAFLAKALPAEWCVIWAPHDISPRHLQQIEQRLPLTYERYSSWLTAAPGSSRILLVDNIGMLSGLYQYGRIAYIGGGFGAGIHNILEPMAFQLPVLFGPKYHNFAEARTMVTQGAALVVERKEDLEKAFRELNQPDHYLECQAVIAAYLQGNQDATTRIFSSLSSRFFLPGEYGEG